MESFPLSALGAKLWDGTSSHFTPGGVLFAKAEGSSGREFLSQWVENWMLLKGILVSLPNLGGWELPPLPQPLGLN